MDTIRELVQAHTAYLGDIFSFLARRRTVATRGLELIFAACVALFGAPVEAFGQDKDPIATIGHGAFFDREGRQIAVTRAFVEQSLTWYRGRLIAGLDRTRLKDFEAFEKRLNTEFPVEGQSRMVVRYRALEWLAANSAGGRVDDRTLAKIRALQQALEWRLPEASDLGVPEKKEPFTLDPSLQKRLESPQFKPLGGLHVFSATVNTGQAYINECMAAGVPIPPPIGQMDPAGLAGWKTQGFIPTTQQFIVGTPAEVRTYQSNSPVGMCVALPRYSDASKATVSLDGVICQGKVSSKVCFWDNQMMGAGFSFPAGTKIPIGLPDLAINPAGQYQAGGFELNNGTGGVCSDCHSGENPYIIHPRADLGAGVLMGDLGDPPLNLPTFANNRYDPLVPLSWPQNQLSQSQALVPGVCSGCHDAGGSGGRFPHLSTSIPDYCSTILTQAIAKTMPPGSPGSQASNPDVIAFKNWCTQGATSGPSNRGDPHVTTTNGVNYDFQAAGEFVALRNSATGFQLQNRQTPVATTFTPGANPYTGLSSCVSLNTAVAVRVGKHRITYQPGLGGLARPERMQLRIDGRIVQPTSSGINLGNGDVLSSTGAGGALDFKLSDGTHFLVTPLFWTSQGYWYLNIDVLETPAREGTMGAVLGAEWLPLGPKGSSFGPRPASLLDRHVLLNQKFANAWRVDKATSMFDYAAGTSTLDFTDENWPPETGKPCTSALSTNPPVKRTQPELAQRVCRLIKDKTLRDNCVFDVTVMGDPGLAKDYVRADSRSKPVFAGTP